MRPRSNAGLTFGFPAFSFRKLYSNEQFGFVPVSVCMVNCATALFVMQFLLALCFRVAPLSKRVRLTSINLVGAKVAQALTCVRLRGHRLMSVLLSARFTESLGGFVSYV